MGVRFRVRFTESLDKFFTCFGENHVIVDDKNDYHIIEVRKTVKLGCCDLKSYRSLSSTGTDNEKGSSGLF